MNRQAGGERHSSLPTAAVLLSVHGRTPYLAEQLESLANQVGVEVRLTYHMDDLDDRCSQIVEQYFPEAKRIDEPGGLGLPHAYLRLLEWAPVADFYAFCDQDDVWESDKLLRASKEFTFDDDQPRLWLGRAVVFEEENPRSGLSSQENVRAEKDFGAALVQTLSPGCSMVWNIALQRKIKSTLPTEQVMMHDSWVGLIAAATGVVTKGSEIGTWYRQHSTNAIGLKKPMVKRGFSLLGRVGRGRPNFASQAAELLRYFAPEMDRDDVQTAVAVADWNRPRLLLLWLRKRIWRGGRGENALLLLRLLLPR